MDGEISNAPNTNPENKKTKKIESSNAPNTNPENKKTKKLRSANPENKKIKNQHLKGRVNAWTSFGKKTQNNL